jgi:hypothetical protein
MGAAFSNLFSQVSTSFKYNLQVLPDTLMAGMMLFALLFQSAALATFAICLVVHAGLYQTFAAFLGRNIPGVRQVSRQGTCSGKFPGSSYLRSATMANGAYDVTDNEWPSYYASFMGFFLGYLVALPTIYKQELAASPQRSVSTTGGIVIAVIVLLLSITYRMVSGCDDLIGSVAGTALGGIVGFALANAIAYASNRSLTNILALPLFTSKVAAGRPLYVCAP